MNEKTVKKIRKETRRSVNRKFNRYMSHNFFRRLWIALHIIFAIPIDVR